MDLSFYNKEFNEALKEIPKQNFHNQGLEISVEFVLNSIALKIYNPNWTSEPESPLNAKSRIFFSIWINKKTITENRVYYNIHALKLRELKGYKIQSRNFADLFRSKFSNFQTEWENIDTALGPLTLMEGWINLNKETIKSDIIKLSENFLKVSPIIDSALNNFKYK
ncbi:hypothetical protein ACM39_04210 [Chryseobacterium sp. FH2]|uniref:hypothetical protein n=1 Tax=Chryseobacterium sp. FH2 TaxID=1674291 RepID=UPI00065A99A2|nr:hypothetical protein [Chryseobacterium sp. FH2]KMQ69300.1 hypothetical protein ACM39_04210 [Chryseobacterium sp. FH2]